MLSMERVVDSSWERVEAVRRRVSSMLALMEAYLSRRDMAPPGRGGVWRDVIVGCWCLVGCG